MSYINNPEHKQIIDCVLKQNALMFANLGSDSSKAEYKKVKIQERQKLRNIHHLDPEKIERLVNDSLND